MLDEPHKLNDYEVLELLLGHVLLRRDTKPLAKDLLERFKSIRGVLEAKPEQLLSLEGFGPSVAAYWVLLREVMARHSASPLLLREVLASPSAVAAMARQRLAGCPHEEVWVAFLDNSNNLLHWERASKGSVNTTPIYPRDIVARALKLTASAIILVHNHPGGNKGPSGLDLNMTKELEKAALTMNIRLIDHIIVTDESCYSLHQDGLI